MQDPSYLEKSLCERRARRDSHEQVWATGPACSCPQHLPNRSHPYLPAFCTVHGVFIKTKILCFGSRFVFYASGSWIFFPIRIRIQAKKNKFFQRPKQNFGRNFCFQPKKYQVFYFCFNQSSRYLSQTGNFYLVTFLKTSENQ